MGAKRLGSPTSLYNDKAIGGSIEDPDPTKSIGYGYPSPLIPSPSP
jgi:hypothetical protein